MKRNNAGFTIIELMIALSIVSLILLLAAVTIINIGNLFYKGVTQTNVQDNVRAITDEIASHLQLNSGSVGSYSLTINGHPGGYYCINGTRYTYVKNVNLGSGAGQSPHVLWRDTVASGQCPAPSSNWPNITTAGTELVGPNSRLTEFSISGISSTPQPYTVTVGIAYGDPTLTSGGSTNTYCKGTTGEQFCATSFLITTVAQRLN